MIMILSIYIMCWFAIHASLMKCQLNFYKQVIYILYRRINTNLYIMNPDRTFQILSNYLSCQTCMQSFYIFFCMCTCVYMYGMCTYVFPCMWLHTHVCVCTCGGPTWTWTSSLIILFCRLRHGFSFMISVSLVTRFSWDALSPSPEWWDNTQMPGLLGFAVDSEHPDSGWMLCGKFSKHSSLSPSSTFVIL